MKKKVQGEFFVKKLVIIVFEKLVIIWSFDTIIAIGIDDFLNDIFYVLLNQ